MVTYKGEEVKQSLMTLRLGFNFFPSENFTRREIGDNLRQYLDVE